ncbi:outer membrane protein assembly factor BamE [Vibrio agarivorans]|uniref:outer membrane protein assembly factor BamE n=1 Tax=Vibrio agarivorans TaxID=153622 RepID=UPI0025B5342E|nr:outer membrane protein assembly factor BamE [Vibrio agarivorans]MDN3661088.1 outer membrane protein assembly factor BamE [Vibrio agarivorans]
MKSFLKKTCTIAITLFVVGCSATQHGSPINFTKLERLSLGLSTQDTVKETFGYPQTIEYPDTRTIYKYRFYQKKYANVTKQGVDFVFNDKQRLIDITINDASDFGEPNQPQ